MPLFLLAIFMFWNMFSALDFQIRLQAAMDALTAELAQQSYLAEPLEEDREQEAEGEQEEGADLAAFLQTAAWQGYAAARLVQSLGRETLNASPVHRGARGLSLSASTWDRKGDICLVVRYRLKIAGIPGLSIKITAEQASRRRCWSGMEPEGSPGENGSGELVYVADTGRVYHRDGSCYHLNVGIRKVSLSQARAARNNSGSRYTPCEHCTVSAAESGTVFITPEGRHYHIARECSGLKRTVHLVPLQETTLPPCSHCCRGQED